MIQIFGVKRAVDLPIGLWPTEKAKAYLANRPIPYRLTPKGKAQAEKRKGAR